MTRDERLAVVIVGAGDWGASHSMHGSEAGARVLAIVDVDGARVAARP